MISTPNCKIAQEDCVHFLASLEGGSVDLIFCDPPHGTVHEGISSPGQDFGFGHKVESDPIMGNSLEYLNWCEPWIRECYRVLTPTGNAFFMGTHNSIGWMLASALIAGFQTRNLITWSVTNPVPPLARRLTTSCTFIAWVVKGGKYYFDRGASRRFGNHRQLSDLWTSRSQRKSEKHGYPMTKPEWLLERIVSIWSSPNALVVDPFFGSGTTAVVALRLGRRFAGCDIDPRAVAIAEGRVRGVHQV